MAATASVAERNRDLIHRYWTALTTGHIEDFAPLVHEDAVFHYPGNHFLSGNYRGKEAVVGLYTNLIKLAGGGVFRGVLHDVAVGEEYTVAILSYRMQLMRTRSLPGRACGLFRIVGGKIREYWLFEWDQSMINDLVRTAGGGIVWRNRGPLRFIVSLPRSAVGSVRTAGRLFGGRYTAPTEV